MNEQERLARRLLDIMNAGCGPSGWSRARWWYAEIDGTTRARLTGWDEHGRELRRVPGNWDDDGRWSRLRSAMAGPETGAWLSASVDLVAGARFSWTFNYDRRVYVNGLEPDYLAPSEHLPAEPTDDEYAADLARHPRSPENLPDWYPRAVRPPPPPRPRPPADNPLTRAIRRQPNLFGPYTDLVGAGDWERVFVLADDRVLALLKRFAADPDSPYAAEPPLPHLDEGLEQLLEDLVPGVLADVREHGIDVDALHRAAQPQLGATFHQDNPKFDVDQLVVRLTRYDLRCRFGFDRNLLVWWAGRAGMVPFRGSQGDLVAVTDMEIDYYLVRRDDRCAVDRGDRGARRTVGTFGSALSAYRYLLAVLGVEVRSRLGLAPVRLGAPVEPAETGTCRVADAEFSGATTGQLAARLHAEVADATPEQIVASFQDADGRPLFS